LKTAGFCDFDYSRCQGGHLSSLEAFRQQLEGPQHRGKTARELQPGLRGSANLKLWTRSSTLI
jgi:hypothetical protein